jgi:hypothetical protein
MEKKIFLTFKKLFHCVTPEQTSGFFLIIILSSIEIILPLKFRGLLWGNTVEIFSPCSRA